ncbi:MAG: Ig-like domain-containing protein [Acidimicrobiales bacterium]
MRIRQVFAVFIVVVALLVPASQSNAVPGDQSFTFLEAGFTQDLIGVDPGFMGGVAFAADGDPLVSPCTRGGGSLRRFDLGATPIPVNGSELAPVSSVASSAGCGLTSHPNGDIYSNTSSGVVRINPETGALIEGPFGDGGNALGITVNPQTAELAYVGARGEVFAVDPELGSMRVLSNALQGKFLDGLFFSPSGNFLFAADRTSQALAVLDTVDGSLVQSVPLGREPDGVAFHATAPQFVLTVNLDGTITRIDFENDEFTGPATTSLFASGGFRGDLSEVGPDGCLYLTQNGVRYADGTTGTSNSLVRICGDFAPPAGAFLDRDGDALLDIWEEDGIDFDGDGTIDVDLPAMGADPDRKDIFMEIDWMVGHEPDPAALADIVSAFANAPTPIALHIDAGPASLLNDGTPWGTLAEGNSLALDSVLGEWPPGGDYSWAEFQTIKDANLDDSRRDAFHYVVYGSRGPEPESGTTPSTGLLGISRGIPGSDAVVFDRVVANRPEVEATNLMHEFGHNLNLGHGGSDQTGAFNFKPNYLSVMNYSFSIFGLVRPGGAEFVDYSRNELVSLDEGALDEPDGLNIIGGGKPSNIQTRYSCPDGTVSTVPADQAIDWDCSGDAGGIDVTADINSQRGNASPGQTLDGYNDWENVRFNGGLIGANQAIETNPMTTEVDDDRDADEIIALLGLEYGILADVSDLTIEVAAGTSQTLTLPVTSYGSADDTVAVGVDSSGGEPSVTPVEPLLPIVAGGDVNVDLLVDATSASPGTADFDVEVTSQGDMSKRVVVAVQVIVTEDGNSVPDAIDDAASGQIGETISIDLLSNDIFGDGGEEAATASLITEPALGSADLDGGLLTYVGSVAGVDEFVYELCDVDEDCDQATVAITVGEPLPGSPGTYFSVGFDGKVGDLAFKDEDVLRYLDGELTMHFDGSDVGVGGRGGRDVDAVAVMQDGSLLLSFFGSVRVPGLGLVDNSDVVRFVPTSVGENTSGTFEWFFDGSDVGLTQSTEAVDAISMLPSGDIVISVHQSAVVTAADGSTIEARDEDLLLFMPETLGEETAGSFAVFMDNSDIGFTSLTEDVWGVHVDGTDVAVTTRGLYSLGGLVGSGGDVLVCSAAVTGLETSCSGLQLVLDGMGIGLRGNTMDGIHLETAQ